MERSRVTSRGRAALIRVALVAALVLLVALVVLEVVGERKVWIDEATLDPVYDPHLLPTPDGNPHLLPTPDGSLHLLPTPDGLEHGLDDPVRGSGRRRLPDRGCLS